MTDDEAMAAALLEAEHALAAGEVPVGAVLVGADGIVARAHNRREQDRDPVAHAELLAIREGSRSLRRWRLSGTTLVVTLEPCAMCAGALVLARVDRVVFGAPDARRGALVSAFRVADDPRLNHRVVITGGILAEASEALMRQFFQQHRR